MSLIIDTDDRIIERYYTEGSLLVLFYKKHYIYFTR